MEVGSLKIQVVKKDIKNIHLSVYPPDGKVRLATPRSVKEETLRLFVVSKIGWIRKQQRMLERQVRESPKEYISRESHYYLGKRYLLKVIELDQKPEVEIIGKYLVMKIRPGTSLQKRNDLLKLWYRKELKMLITPLIAKWERKMNVQVEACSGRQMKTKWGTCNIESKRVSINIELAKKPIDCLEFVIVHEMAHLLERKHSERFMFLMSKFLPTWKSARQKLNRLPVPK